MAIRFSNDCSTLSLSQLSGFFQEWPSPPPAETLLRILQRSSYSVIATEDSTFQVVGYIVALSDGMISAFVPMLEVLPPYRHQGIGSALVRRMMNNLKSLPVIDLVCNVTLSSFYRGQDFSRYFAKVQYQYCPNSFLAQ